MRSGYIPSDEMRHVLAALMPPNRLVCEIALATGLRLGDVLSLRTLEVTQNNRFTVQEQKTGKRRRVYLPQDLRDRALAQAGTIYLFPGRLSGRQHRTRQAVYKDLRRAADLFRLPAHISPHSCRKAWAVDKLAEFGGDLKRVQKLMNHENEAVTMLYAMADHLERRKRGRS